MKKPPRQTALARRLRREQTEAERVLWARLRSRQLEGVKFRRQQPLGPYIVDFVSLERKLIVEVDGGHHAGEEARERDEQRSAWLREGGYRVLRFWNNEVLANKDGNLERIREALDPHPQQGEGSSVLPPLAGGSEREGGPSTGSGRAVYPPQPEGCGIDATP